LVCLAVLLSLRPAPASAEIVEREQVGDWTVLYANDQSEGSALCNASRVNDQGVVFSIMAERSNHVWYFVVGGSNVLQVQPWSEFDVVYAIDGKTMTRKALATSASSVTVLLGKSFDSTDPLRHGSRMEVRVDDETFSFSLSGSARALERVLDCANRNLGFAEVKSPANPFVAAAPQSKPEVTTPGEPKVVEERDLGGWTLMATTGEGANCMVTRPDVEGPILGITVQGPKNLWFFTLAYDSWHQEVGAFYAIDYAIDDGPSVATVAQAKSPSMMVIPLGKSHAVTEPFRHGSTLDFRMSAGTIALFDLAGSGQALDALIDCAHRRLGI
jgi:hypothetical protein